ncbi:hypothetical protein [Egbenema bharatensis]|uniref:hypothetical protein n=1 Tax=Egbenema bharatensis TaxID=3463334 RepID=UPI003A88954D
MQPIDSSERSLIVHEFTLNPGVSIFYDVTGTLILCFRVLNSRVMQILHSVGTIEAG